MQTLYFGIRCRSSGVRIGRSVRLNSRRNIELWQDVTIGDYCRMYAGVNPRSISIGDGTVVHEFCILRSSGGTALLTLFVCSTGMGV